MDITGQKFGDWLVLQKDQEKSGGHYGNYWICQCKCGFQSSIRGTALKSGKSKSCRTCGNKRTHIKDEIGNTYGLLTVLSLDENMTDSNHFKQRHLAFWKSQCKCGNIVSVPGQYLRNGWTKSCGCLNGSCGEQIIANLLQQNSISFIQDKAVFKDLIMPSGNIGRYDFVLINEDNQPYRLIEFDGIQHYQETQYFSCNLASNQQRDKIKNDYAKLHNLPLVRIPYWAINEITIEKLLGEEYLV